MFIRFLIAQGRCQPTLLDAIPRIASWRQRSLPYYLTAEEIERLLATCEAATPRQSRDRAVLLLLARLGLRARDITALTLHDIEWHEGTFRVRGKNRRETRLPLPQEVGEAIWTYMQHHRPTVPIEHVFLTTIAPLAPINQRLVSQIVAHAVQRAGLKVPPVARISYAIQPRPRCSVMASLWKALARCCAMPRWILRWSIPRLTPTSCGRWSSHGRRTRHAHARHRHLPGPTPCGRISLTRHRTISPVLCPLCQRPWGDACPEPDRCRLGWPSAHRA